MKINLCLARRVGISLAAAQVVGIIVHGIPPRRDGINKIQNVAVQSGGFIREQVYFILLFSISDNHTRLTLSRKSHTIRHYNLCERKILFVVLQPLPRLSLEN